jgi:glycerol-3-phosphate acyltransferase PlsY
MSLVLIVILAAYLIGGIPFGLLIARACGIKDVRAHGSGNIGATNVWRIVGRGAGAWVFALDVGKGVVAVLLAKVVEQSTLSNDLFLVLTALTAVFGHIFSPFIRFKGGKGVNTGLGVMLVLMPTEILISLGVFAVVVAISRFISLGSIVASLTLVAAAFIEKYWLHIQVSNIHLGLTVVLSAAIIVTHRMNIRRLCDGTESRFSFSSRQSTGGSPHV